MTGKHTKISFAVNADKKLTGLGSISSTSQKTDWVENIMVTLLLEIINHNSANTDFYNPAQNNCRAYPRTETGIKKAIHKMKKLALSMEFAEDFRIACYDGRKEYWNDRPLIGYIPKEVILTEF